MIPVLGCEGLAIGYTGRRGARRVVLADLDLGVAAGELTCLLGANGSGKSTLLRTLAGMQPSLGGRATLLGEDLDDLPDAERARRLAVVLTDPVDAGLMRGADLVALGRHPHTGWSGRLGPDDRAAVAWALRVSGAEALACRPVSELSDGERQRVLLARALAQQPALLALDEPVAFIDPPRRLGLAQLLRHLARECDLAVLLTTHDLDLALRSADRLWVIEPAQASSGQPARLHVGAPEDLVLSGAVARAFPSDDVTFDTLRGMFVPHPPVLGRVRVGGDGPPAVWAARAMEREGLAVVSGAETADLDVEVGPGPPPTWWLTSALGVEEHHTIGALVGSVRAVLPGLAAAGASERSARWGSSLAEEVTGG